MNDNPRKQQLHDDTLATLDIASEMVTALFANLSATLEEKDREIRRLRQRIAELTAQRSNNDAWLDYHEPTPSGLCADTNDLAGITGVGQVLKPRIHP